MAIKLSIPDNQSLLWIAGMALVCLTWWHTEYDENGHVLSPAEAKVVKQNRAYNKHLLNTATVTAGCSEDWTAVEAPIGPYGLDVGPPMVLALVPNDLSKPAVRLAISDPQTYHQPDGYKMHEYLRDHVMECFNEEFDSLEEIYHDFKKEYMLQVKPTEVEEWDTADSPTDGDT